MVVATEREVLQSITRHYDSEAESVEKLVQLADDESKGCHFRVGKREVQHHRCGSPRGLRPCP